MMNSSQQQQPPQQQQQRRKSQHFLSDVERYLIIQRLDQGEKQTALAKEFGVTRATICNINKNRDEICVRYEILAQTAEGQAQIEHCRQAVQLARQTSVRIVHTTTAQVLLTRLRDAGTDAATAVAAVNRLKRILLEDALASFGTITSPVDMQSVQSIARSTTIYVQSVCAVAVDHQEQQLGMLDEFARMEPRAARGTIQARRAPEPEHGGDGLWHVTGVQLPVEIADCNVVVLHVACVDVALVWAVLETLRAHNVGLPRICLASLVCSNSAIATLASACPDLKVVTTAVIEDPLLGSTLLLSRLTAGER